MSLRRRTFFFLFLLLFVQLISGQIAWDWVQHSSVPGPDEANDIIVDNCRNIYITGYYTNVELPMYNLKDKDAFIAKYDSSGVLIWYQKYGMEEADDIGNGIALDDSNNVYVTGSYNYGKKMFLIKLDDETGDLQWEIFDSTLTTNIGDDLLIKDSSIYVTGTIPLFRYDLNGNSLPGFKKSEYKSINALDVPATAIATNNSNLIYVTRDNTILIFDTTGLQISSRQLSVTRINSLTIDDLYNIYCTGFFSGFIKLGNYQLKSSGYDDIFICKIDSSGTISWAVKAGGSDFDEGLGIALSKKNELFITGFYRQIATFGNQTVGQLGLFKEIFVIKTDPETGKFTDLLVAGGGGDFDLGNKIAIDNDNFPYVAGLLDHYWPGMNFGDIYVPAEDGSTEDAFIAKIKVPDIISILKGQVFKDSIPTQCVVKLFSYSSDNPMRLLYNSYTNESGLFEYTVYRKSFYFIQAIQPLNFNYAKTYFEHNYKWDSAFHFSLNHDTIISGINIHLLKLPDLNGNDTISGTVYDISGEPKRWIDMILVDDSGNLTDYTQTDTVGNYEFTSIPQGNFTILIDSAGMFVKSSYTLNTALKSSYIGFDYILGTDSIFRADDFKVSSESDTFSLDELCLNGTLVGYLNVPNQSRLKTINFTILEQDRNNAFGITPGSGKIFVFDSTLINYEDLSVHRLIIYVENTIPIYSSDTIVIIIWIKDINENTGMNDQIIKPETLRIFPSPVIDRLFIIQENINDPINEVIILDLSGRIIFNKKAHGKTDMMIDLKTWENSTYIIKVHLNSGQVKQIFIKTG